VLYESQSAAVIGLSSVVIGDGGLVILLLLLLLLLVVVVVVVLVVVVGQNSIRVMLRCHRLKFSIIAV